MSFSDLVDHFATPPRQFQLDIVNHLIQKTGTMIIICSDLVMIVIKTLILRG
jgi:hypothetical protein